MVAATGVRRIGLVLLTAAALLGGHPGASTSVSRISAQYLKVNMDAGRTMVIVDARDAEQFRLGHIPGARSIPLPDVPKRSGELPRTDMVVFYAESDDIDPVYWFLRRLGFRNVTVLQDGFQAWRQEGYPVER